MGWISGVFVQKAIDAASLAADAPADLYQSLSSMAGIDPDRLSDPKHMVLDDVFFDLLERIADDFECGRSIPIEMGASMRCDDYGAFGLAFKSAETLLGSYRRVERFGKVVTSVANFRLVQPGRSVLMEVIPEHQQRLGATMTKELAIAAAVALSREVCTGAFTPRAVHLMGEGPKDDAVYQAYFQCPIRFSSDCDALEIDCETANLANRLADQGMSQFFEAHLDRELGDIAEDARLERRVLDLIRDGLNEGVPKLSAIAGKVGMSDRTLQRRLSEAGLSYQDLVGEARKTLSERLVLAREYSLAEIAFLTGFSDQSTFTRAFKRWYGQPPANYRGKDQR